MDKSWKLPDLKEAQKRSQQHVEINRDGFEIPQEAQGMGQGKFYFIRTYGCQANERDSETMAGILEAMGYTQCNHFEKADVILVNTCAIRGNAENRAFGELGEMKRLKKSNPNLIIGLCGCMAQEESAVHMILNSYRQVDIIFGTHNIHRLPQLLWNTYQSKKRTVEVLSQQGSVIENLPVRRFGTHKAWVNIMYGCDKFCTYCIVPYTRGKERSRLMEDIVQEVEELVAQGYKEVSLLGQNVNAYGNDLGYEDGFGKLLKAVSATGISRIRFMTSNPWNFTNGMVEAIANCENIMPFIHFPVQSGNNEVLKRMGRRYTVEEYKEVYDRIKKAIPHCAFTTDIIVGFPQETEEQFKDTLAICDYCQFDYAYTFIYSPRKGTPAAKMQDDIPKEVKDERLQRLQDLCDQYANDNNEKYVGRVVEVLVDGPSKKNSEVYSGYTDTNKLVNFKKKPNTQVGDLVKVLINAHTSYTLRGDEIDE